MRFPNEKFLPILSCLIFLYSCTGSQPTAPETVEQAVTSQGVVVDLPLHNTGPVRYASIWPAGGKDIEITEPRGTLALSLPAREGAVWLTDSPSLAATHDR